MAEKQHKRVALLAGCTYPGTAYALRGCINDVRNIKPLLTKRFDFQDSNITLLVDEKNTAETVRSTGANIKKKLKEMINNADDGDLVLFYFSGHGTQGDFSTFRKDEAIVPTDLNLITDVDFRYMLRDFAKEATFVLISDSCHSGGLLDKGDIGDPKLPTDPEDQRKPKFIPFQKLKEILQTENVADKMKDKFKEDASSKFREQEKSWKKVPNVKDDRIILLSACTADQVAYDANDSKGKPAGAFSAALRKILRAHREPLPNIKTLELVKDKVELNFSQTPCLHCTDKHKQDLFLLQQHDAPKEIIMESDADDETNTDPDIPVPPTVGKDVSPLADIREATKAYYYALAPKPTRSKVMNLFQLLDKDKSGQVKAKDAFDLFVSVGQSVQSLSEKLKIGFDTLLNFTDFLVVYYASKSKSLFCQNCKTILKAFHFTCLECFNEKRETYNICPNCCLQGVKCGKCNTAGHFLDNQALLELYHLRQINSQDVQGTSSDTEGLKAKLKMAEKSYLREISSSDAPKAFALDLGMHVDDTCSIM